ncbi:MAG: sigma-54-dependent Fis family transcriptional regulator [Alphaproteobacteria bacterium]|nr:sigma-54-dependent Fis family transcriptional regulator [Alphaproteobacteria bacterium]
MSVTAGESGIRPPLVFPANRRGSHSGEASGVSALTDLPGLRDVYNLANRLAVTRYPILVLGETGTGKEVLCRHIHSRSSVARGPFLAVNCGAIPRELIESTLFGHEKGAFTGAAGRKEGYFEAANNGTLFLDEIGDMPLDLQTRLLRVLQDGAFSRVGGNAEIPTNARVILATHRDLKAAVAEGKFREDLYYRINGFTLAVPPLRERPKDLSILARHFAEVVAKREGRDVPQISRAAMALLREHDWPGNIRELENAMTWAVVLGENDPLEPSDFPEIVKAGDTRKLRAAANPVAGPQHSWWGAPVELGDPFRQAVFFPSLSVPPDVAVPAASAAAPPEGCGIPAAFMESYIELATGLVTNNLSYRQFCAFETKMRKNETFSATDRDPVRSRLTARLMEEVGTMSDESRDRLFDAVHRRYIVDALLQTTTVNQAAKHLGVKESDLRNTAERLEIGLEFVTDFKAMPRRPRPARDCAL